MKLLGHKPVNELILVLSGPSVRRDSDGVPIAFLVMKPGTMSLTINGQKLAAQVSADDIRSILTQHALKGEHIPVDCEHLLQILADVKGVDEATLVRNEPLLGERAAAGVVSLRDEHGELWAHVERWTDRARELLSGKSDKMYAYFSPVLRGLTDGPLRITSIALTNVPAINKQEMLAANDLTSADSALPEANVIALTDEPKPRRPQMKDWLKKLATLLGKDSASFTAEDADAAPLLQLAHETIEQERGCRSSFIESLTDALSLTDTDTLDTVAGKVLSLAAKSESDVAALTELQTRVQSLEGQEHGRAITRLQAEGKLTEAMLPWAKKQNTAALIEWSETAPVVVKPGREINPEDTSHGDDQLALTDADRKVAEAAGFTAEQVAEANNLKSE